MLDSVFHTVFINPDISQRLMRTYGQTDDSKLYLRFANA